MLNLSDSYTAKQKNDKATASQALSVNFEDETQKYTDLPLTTR